MASVPVLFLALFVGVAMGTTLRWDTFESDVIETDIQPDDVSQLVSEFLALTEDDYRKIVDEVVSTVLKMHGGLCHGDTCKICLRRLPILGAVCLELEYVRSPSSLHLVLTKNGHEIICITFHNELPKICLFHHLCAQVVDIKITNGKLCASLAFNGKNVVKNRCIHL